MQALGNRNELVRRQQAKATTVPAQQRLDADQALAVGGQFGLEVKLVFAVVNCRL